ncbi:MAG: hypothetical protein AB1567_01460, partial [bacterium]
MEIKVSISAIISIHDGKVNVNEILYETGKFCDSLKKGMAEKIIEHYQEAVINKMCEAEEELGIEEHIKKGIDEEVCKDKRYIRHGYREQKRKIKADFGEIEFGVMNIKCKG